MHIDELTEAQQTAALLEAKDVTIEAKDREIADLRVELHQARELNEYYSHSVQAWADIARGANLKLAKSDNAHRTYRILTVFCLGAFILGIAATLVVGAVL